MPAPVCPESSLESSIQKDISLGPLVWFLTNFAHFSLSLAKRVISPGNVSVSIHSVCLVPSVVSMLVPSATVLVSRCPKVSLSGPIGLNQSLSPSVNFQAVFAPCPVVV